MDTNQPINQEKLLTLQEASQKLGASVETLLAWNEYNILKPTITHAGTVGYTETQIAQFLRIQQSFQSIQQPPQTTSQPLPTSYPSPPAPLPQNFDNLLEVPISHNIQPSNTAKFPFLFFTIIFFVFALTGVGILTQQGHLQSLLGSYEKSYEAKTLSSSPQTSDLKLNSSLAIVPSTTHKSDGDLSKNDTNSMFAQKPTNAPTPSKSITPTPSSNQQSRVLNATIAGVMKSILDKKTAATNEPATSNVLTFASLTTSKPHSSMPNSPFDKSGNLTGNTAKSDLLVTDMSGVDIVGVSRSFDQLNNNLQNQLIFVVISGLLFVFYLLKRPHPAAEVVIPTQNIASSERLFELDQKMDGTVVLYYQGKAYKISKPELHSDSDQFIERLMTLYHPGSKEMEYDTSEDNLKLTAPLSRLVTRLGFVGVKRDLFFPRTSKHSVLFRKYITHNDLAAMNVTVDQILRNMTAVA